MRLVALSPEAEADLLDIASYIAADNPDRARTFVDELEGRCAALAEFPERGRERPDLAPGLRSMPHRHYVIYYTPEAEVVRIERILHGAREAQPRQLA